MAPDKHEFYKDMDGTMNARISQKWVNHEVFCAWWWGFGVGMIVGFLSCAFFVSMT